MNPNPVSGNAISRRHFLQTAAMAGGLIVGFRLGPRLTAAAASPAPFSPNAFLRIAPNGAITIIAKHAEIGQGVYTSLAMCIAEELDADWSRIAIEAAPSREVYTNNAFQVKATGGSTSTLESFGQMREAGAMARALLVQAAAEKWGLDGIALLRTENGAVFAPDGRRATYGELAEAAAKLPAPKSVKLKAPADWKLIGKATPRIDAREKVTGVVRYGIDVSVPGMLTALVARSPVPGGKVLKFDATAAQKVPGVKQVVAVPSGVAVIADSVWTAKRGRDALKVEWDRGPSASLDSVTQRGSYLDMAQQPGAVAKKTGDAPAAFAAAATKIEATFDFPYLAHAPMEPLNATAHARGDEIEVWAPTQSSGLDVAILAATFKVPAEKITVHTMMAGGGFGRKLNPHADFIVEAVHVSRAAGAPVRVVWLREDDMRGGYYRPRTLVTARVGLDASGGLQSWENHVVNQSVVKGTDFESVFFKDGVDALQVDGLAELSYAVPNLQVAYHVMPNPVPPLWWRSVGHSYTGFVKETLIDDAARAAKKDPIEYRIGLLGAEPRQVAILRLLREKSNWGRPAAGRHQGVAIHASFGSIIGQVAEISIDANRQIRVHKVTAVVDCGTAVNPAGVRAQVMSAVIFGLSAALHGQITFRNGEVQQSNFHDYPLLRFAEAPVVETHIINSGEAMGGMGEPGLPPIAPAVANAILAATGRRVRSLPMTPDKLA